jgi:hypothetical protein
MTSFSAWVRANNWIKKRGIRFLRVFGRPIEVVPPFGAVPFFECPGYDIETDEYVAGCALTRRWENALGFEVFTLVDKSIRTSVSLDCDDQGDVSRIYRFNVIELGGTPNDKRDPMGFIERMFNEVNCSGTPLLFDYSK